jgi:hypothetical protein
LCALLLRTHGNRGRAAYVQRTVSDSLVVRYDPRPVVLPVGLVVAATVAGALISHRLNFSWAGSPGAVVLFFRRTWLVARRTVALEVGPGGVHFGRTLAKPRQPAEFIPWERISAVEVTSDDDRTYVLLRGLPDTGSGHGPRIAWREVNGWRLDRQALREAVRRHRPA